MTKLIRHTLAGALVLASATLANTAGAQQTLPGQLYMPRAVKQAFQKGTRSTTGMPGAKYWQNRARYTIDVTALPPSRNVTGHEQITYMNNSPDTLRMLVMKLFLNIHKPGAPRNGGASEDYLTNGIQIDTVRVNGQPVAWRLGPYFTVAPLRLPTALMPHDSVRLSFDWHYEISKEAGREGMLDSTSYYLAYFYPRVAVYDDYNGWDTMTFTDQQEFYSDFNDYDVTVHVPANYVVWGTGTLTNAAQVLQPAVMQRFTTSMAVDSTVRIATKQDMASHAVTTQGAGNAWHFTASNIPDVTFALSDHYVWDGGSVVVDDATHRRTSVQAAYNDTAPDFPYMVQMNRHSLDFLSHVWPGVPYPYEKSTTVQGSADMEYPMMVNDGSNADTSFSAFVAAHEIAHTYMPFYMGINETRYGFMDEGWATTFEYLRNLAVMGPAQATKFYQQFRVNRWAADPSPLEDFPIITPEDVLEGAAYGNNAYGKASIGYLAMKDMLGDSLFRVALHAYMDTWHGKHPTPWDFFNIFNTATHRDLNWFWNAWYFSNGYIDIAVKDVKKARGGTAVTLSNVGGFPAPVDLVLTFTDGTTQTVHETSAIWHKNLETAVVTVPTKKAVKSVQLAHGIWVDADTKNDSWSAK